MNLVQTKKLVSTESRQFSDKDGPHLTSLISKEFE